MKTKSKYDGTAMERCLGEMGIVSVLAESVFWMYDLQVINMGCGSNP